jgi:multicomponent Na+:H+ antiporter subunit D
VNHLPVAAVLLPLAAAFCIAFLGAVSQRMARVIAQVAVILDLIVAVLIWRTVSTAGPMSYAVGGWLPPLGIALRIDAAVASFLVLLALVTGLVIMYAANGGGEDTSQAEGHWFWVMALVALGSMAGVLMAGDLFNLFVMVEITSIVSYGLVSVRRTGAALEASFKYLVLGGVGTGMLLLATALIYGVTGYLDLPLAGAAMPQALADYPYAGMAALGLLTIGYGVKAGLMPFHTWLPDAHSSAPVASSALLSGLVVKVNVLALFKVMLGLWGSAFGGGSPLRGVVLVLSVIAMVAGAGLAWRERDIKRMLAYSTVGHMGYIFAGFAIGSPFAVAGAMYHIVSHALMKSCLFLSAGLWVRQTGSRDVNRITGIGKQMPITSAAFAVAALGMIGFPGTNGFVSKYYIAVGALDGGIPIVAISIIASSLINGMFYLPVVVRAYLGRSRRSEIAAERVPFGRETAPGALAVVVVLAVLIVLTGLWPGGAMAGFLAASRALLPLP